MKRLRVGLCFDAGIPDLEVSSTFLKSVDVVVFPELFDGGYAALSNGAVPHRLNDPILQQFKAASKIFSLICIAGSTLFQRGPSRATNTSLVFNQGRLIHRYDKIHLFRATGDDRFFSRGRFADTFSLRSGSMKLRAGVAICYDLRFPELIRNMALQGMQILFVPARWPKSRDDAWQTLLKARAIENQLFVVGCNALGSEGGYSYAFDPMGRMIFSTRGRSRSKRAKFSIDLTRLDSARSIHRNIEDAVLLKKR